MTIEEKTKLEVAAKACTDIRLGCGCCPFKKEVKKSDRVCWKVRDFIINKGGR